MTGSNVIDFKREILIPDDLESIFNWDVGNILSRSRVHALQFGHIAPAQLAGSEPLARELRIIQELRTSSSSGSNLTGLNVVEHNFSRSL